MSFSQYVTGFQQRNIRPLVDVSLEVRAGEVLAVFGASGAGKSLLAHAVLGILPGNARCAGRITYKGDLLTPDRQARLRGRQIAFIPQSVNFLDPLMAVGKQVQIGLDKDKKRAAQMQQTLFRQYGLNSRHAGLFPHELSGGMLRRVLFATGVRPGVELVLADEPTPGIHPSALEEILNQLARFAREGAGVVLITHDILSALKIAHRVAVLREGRTIENSPASAFEGEGGQLKTGYARSLWKALPQNGFQTGNY